ncbi:MAG: tetratricopeptide repeat protein [Candidatus Hodarchaeales archaeon]
MVEINESSVNPEVISQYRVFIKKAVSLAEDGNYKKAIKLLEEKLKETEKLSVIQPEVDIRNQLGILHWKNNSFEKFLEITASSLALARVHNYKKGVAEALLNLAWVLAMEKKDFIKAFDFTEEALKITEEIGYKKGIATSLYIISSAYKYKNMEDKASYYLEKSLKISMQLADEADLLIPSEAGLTEEEKARLKDALDLI